MQIKNGVINRKSSILTKARDNALKNFYNNEGNIIQLQLADLNMYVNKKCKDDDIKTFYTELDNIFSSSHYDEKIKLHPQQRECVELLENGCNMLISAPTSFGKTYVALEYISRNNFNNIVFVVPTLALMTELSRKICKKFASKYTIVTDSHQALGESNIFVIVPERVDYTFVSSIKNVDLLIFDEIYKLHYDKKLSSNDKRIIPMNVCYFELVSLAQQVLLLGPFIKNVEFQRSNLKDNIIKYYSDYSPVLIECHLIDKSIKDNFIVSKLVTDSRLIVYFSSPNKIYDYCEFVSNKVNDKKSDKLADWCDKNIFPGWIPAKMLRKDICVHFSALPSFFKKYVEFQYNNEVYHNVFCTSTLLEGINTPTEELIVFDSDDMKSPFKLNNLIGRVGRLDTYKKGNVYFFDNDLISLVEDDEKYLSIEIVAETDVANSVEDALFMDKKTSDLTEEDNELLFQTKNIIFEHKINMNVFKTIPMINLQDFINFKFLIPELLNLTRNYLEENDPKQKIKINQEVYSKIIGLFEIKYLFKFNKINGEINDYNKKNDEKIPFIKIDVVIIKLLDMKRNIFKKIKEMVSVYVGKLPDTTLSTYVELLFYLSFNYIKYELAQVVIFYELLFNDDYLLTKPEEDQKIIAEFNEIFLKRIRKRNYDDDPISKALDELGVPATDINYVKKIIENDCKDNFSFSSMVYSIKKNVEKIKANKDIDDLTKEMVEIWI